MKRAAIYARVSSERQAADDRVSIEVQLADCEASCKEKGFIVVDRYVDREKYRVRGRLVQPSGQRKDRPQYRKMLKDALKGKFDVIVAWKEDRLYRGMYAAMPFSEILDELGRKLHIELVKETFDHRMLGIKAAMGKIELDNIRERMMMGRKARLQKGEVPGGDQVKYGYKKVKKRLATHEEEAKIVNKIFEWYIAGCNNMQIRRKLNGLGVPPRRGKLWAKPTIETILTTEAYATGKLFTTLDGETFTIPCPPIISEQTWRKAQKVRKRNRFVARNVKEDYLCVGLVYCACGWKCQTRASASNRKRGYDKVSGYYVCQRRTVNPESMPPDCVYSTGSQKVDDHVWDFVKRVCKESTLLERAIEKKLAKLEAKQGDLEAEANRLQQYLDKLATERQWIITQARKGAITEKDMEMQLATLQLEETSMRRELEERVASVAARKQAEALSDWASRYLSDVHAGMEALDVELETLTKVQQQELATELGAWRFEKRFPDSKLAQLRWAILEEKRRTVRTLIRRVTVGKGNNGKKRKIRPLLTLEVELPHELQSLAYGDQSPDYKVSQDDEMVIE